MGVRIGWEGRVWGDCVVIAFIRGDTTPLLVHQLCSELSHALFPVLIHNDGNGLYLLFWRHGQGFILHLGCCVVT